MMAAVFRARRAGAWLGDEHASALKRMAELATRMPGYVSHDPCVAADGERRTLFEWEPAETLRASATRSEHAATTRLGRDRFCKERHLQVCKVKRELRFRRDADAALG